MAVLHYANASVVYASSSKTRWTLRLLAAAAAAATVAALSTQWICLLVCVCDIAIELPVWFLSAAVRSQGWLFWRAQIYERSRVHNWR